MAERRRPLRGRQSGVGGQRGSRHRLRRLYEQLDKAAQRVDPRRLKTYLRGEDPA